MIAAVRNWWAGLSQRERVLVGIAGALAAALAGWFLILLPLQNAIASANEAHAAAIDRAGAVRARVAALEGGGARTGAAAAASGAAVTLIVTQAAAEAGLPLARNDPAGNDGAAIAISSGRSAAVLALLAALEAQRIGASDLAIRPNGDGSINLTATLRRGAP